MNRDEYITKVNEILNQFPTKKKSKRKSKGDVNVNINYNVNVDDERKLHKYLG